MKIHAVFSQLGFKQVAPQVSLPDQATLCAVEHWIYLQQGLVWKQMAANFAAEGAVMFALIDRRALACIVLVDTTISVAEAMSQYSQAEHPSCYCSGTYSMLLMWACAQLGCCCAELGHDTAKCVTVMLLLSSVIITIVTIAVVAVIFVIIVENTPVRARCMWSKHRSCSAKHICCRHHRPCLT